MYHISLFMHLSMDIGCFLILVVVNNAAVTTEFVYPFK